VQIDGPPVGRLGDLLEGCFQGCPKPASRGGATAKVPAIGLPRFLNGIWVDINLGRNHPPPRRSARLGAGHRGTHAGIPRWFAGRYGCKLYGYFYARDTGQIEQAGEYLMLALAHPEALPIATLCLEGAYFEALYRGNVARASAWLERSRQGTAEKQTRCRAEAAVLWAQGLHAEAATQAEAGLKAIPFSNDLGGRNAEKEWLQDLLNLCLKGMSEGKGSAAAATGRCGEGRP
jgi:hypothetical protein